MFMIRVEEHFIRNEQINKQTWNEEEEIIEQIDENSNNQKFINNLLQTNCSFDKIIRGGGGLVCPERSTENMGIILMLLWLPQTNTYPQKWKYYFRIQSIECRVMKVSIQSQTPELK